MSFALYFAVCLIYAWLCVKAGITDNSESTAIILAILTGAEVISWRCKK
jgi:hypothetical protein